MTQILDYAYLGQVGINHDFLVASDYLSVMSPCEVCSDFLKESLDDMRFAR
jgi:hypothetical protein